MNGDGDSDTGMSDGTLFAIAIFLFVMAGIAWYVALHPGGITDTAFQTEDNPDGRAENAAQVVTFFMNKLATGKDTPSG